MKVINKIRKVHERYLFLYTLSLIPISISVSELAGFHSEAMKDIKRKERERSSGMSIKQ